MNPTAWILLANKSWVLRELVTVDPEAIAG